MRVHRSGAAEVGEFSNISVGKEITIRETAGLIANISVSTKGLPTPYVDFQ